MEVLVTIIAVSKAVEFIKEHVSVDIHQADSYAFNLVFFVFDIVFPFHEIYFLREQCRKAVGITLQPFCIF